MVITEHTHSLFISFSACEASHLVKQSCPHTPASFFQCPPTISFSFSNGIPHPRLLHHITHTHTHLRPSVHAVRPTGTSIARHFHVSRERTKEPASFHRGSGSDLELEIIHHPSSSRQECASGLWIAAFLASMMHDPLTSLAGTATYSIPIPIPVPYALLHHY